MSKNELTRAPEARAQKGHNQLGDMPVWNLDDLYTSNDAPELKADLAAAKADAKSFEADYKGKLEALGLIFDLYGRAPDAPDDSRNLPIMS